MNTGHQKIIENNSIDEYFDLLVSDMTQYIRRNITRGQPIEPLESQIIGLALKYASKIKGMTVDVLNLLVYAAEKGRTMEFGGKLEKFYETNLDPVQQSDRLTKSRTENFILECYKELE